MDFIIKELDNGIIKDIHRIDDEFDIDSKLVLRLEDNRLTYTTVGLLPGKKRYDTDEFDYTTYVDNPEKAVYLAYVDGQIAGELLLRINWNKFAGEDKHPDRYTLENNYLMRIRMIPSIQLKSIR